MDNGAEEQGLIKRGARANHYQHDYNATSWLHLASWNLPDSQLSLESKMEPSVTIMRVGTLRICAYFVNGGNNGGGDAAQH